MKNENEVRLIDANSLKECWSDTNFTGITIRKIIDGCPTIEVESLPVVKQLRMRLDEAYSFEKNCANCLYLEYQDFYAVCGKGILGIVHPSDYCSRFEKVEKDKRKKFCINCQFWDDFNGVCFNHDSLHYGAYEVRGCEDYKEKESDKNENS